MSNFFIHVHFMGWDDFEFCQIDSRDGTFVITVILKFK